MSNPSQFPGQQPATDEFEADLSRDPQAGQNFGAGGAHMEKQSPNAYDIKDLVNRYPEMHVDDLKQITVLLPGSQLEAKAAYIDLQAQEPKEFHALGSEIAGPDNWYVPKTEVDYQLWNRLRGVQDPERTGQADD